MKHKVTLFYLLSFVIICIASLFILHDTHQGAPDIVKKNTIDSYINQATFTEYNKKGQIKKGITASKVTHFALEKKTLFDKPNIIMYSINRTPWHIHADKAVSNATGDKIILTGNVIIRRLQTHKQAAIKLTTTKLILFPKKSQIETDRLVILTRPGTVMSGVGLRANLKTGEYQLISASKVIYQPNKQ